MKKAVLLLTTLILLITPLSGCEDYDLYESNQSSPSISEAPQLSDLELFFKEGHPRFYGLVDDAKTCWKDYPSSKIDIPTYGMGTEHAILYGKGDHPYDLDRPNRIYDLLFCFNYTDNGPVDMATAIDIIKDYFPSPETVPDCELVESYKCHTDSDYYIYIAHYAYAFRKISNGNTIHSDFYIQIDGSSEKIQSIWFTGDRPYYDRNKRNYSIEEWTLDLS